MSGYNNPGVIELENEVLRDRLVKIKTAARDLCVAVERYARQEILRSELMNHKDNLKSLLK